MKKKILSLALIAMTLVGFTGMAQSAKEGSATKKESMKAKKCDRKNRSEKANPFEGINLTEAQKTQLAQLRDKRKAEKKAMKEARKEQKHRNREARMAERRDGKKKYLQEVKSILGPEKYVEFLENSYINSGKGRHGDKSAFGKDKRRKGDKSKMADGKKRGSRKGMPGEFAKDKQRKDNRRDKPAA